LVVDDLTLHVRQVKCGAGQAHQFRSHVLLVGVQLTGQRNLRRIGEGCEFCIRLGVILHHTAGKLFTAPFCALLSASLPKSTSAAPRFVDTRFPLFEFGAAQSNKF